ncbi:MAG: hypothetical protein ACI376_00275 [Candidatus Bruticola sp.]
MKISYLSLTLAAALLLGDALPSLAENSAASGGVGKILAEAAPKKSSPSSTKINNVKRPSAPYPASAIKIGGKIQPGDDLQIVFSVAGPPDEILPMRSKSKAPEDDYIHFIYRNRFTININKANAVQSIMVFGNNVEMVNVPFKIGQKTSDVIEKWKQPEREVSDMYIYYYRGVYVIWDKNNPGKIDRIYLTLPGKVEDDNKNSAVG